MNGMETQRKNTNDFELRIGGRGGRARRRAKITDGTEQKQNTHRHKTQKNIKLADG